MGLCIWDRTDTETNRTRNVLVRCGTTWHVLKQHKFLLFALLLRFNFSLPMKIDNYRAHDNLSYGVINFVCSLMVTCI